MRLVTFKVGRSIGLGLQEEGGVRGVMSEEPRFPGSLEHLLKSGEGALREAGKVLATAKRYGLDEITYLPPLRQPSKIICVGLNYRDHTQEAGFEQPSYPTLFSRFASTLVGHGQPIVHPGLSDTVDYEGEIAAVGVGGRRIRKRDALSHIAGYMLFNDVSVREYQFKAPQWTMGKNFDATGPCGPFFATADELPEGLGGLTLETRLNGKVVQSAPTDDMVFDIPTLIETISEVMTLEPGDLIVTGTPSGVGFGRKPPLYMKPGDVVEIRAEGLGVLRNAVTADAAGSPARLQEQP